MKMQVKEIAVKDLLQEAEKLSAKGTHPLTAMFGRDEANAGKGLSIYVVFEFPELKELQALKAVFGKEEELAYESLTHIIPAAAWYEREIQDMFGIIPKGHPDPRPLVLHENFPEDFHPLLKKYPKDADVPVVSERKFTMHTADGEGVFQVPVGPIHAGIIEPGHFRFSQAGESMLQLDAKLFYTHRGLEKAMEGLSPLEALPIVERICGACSIANTWSFCQAVEAAFNISVPRRAEIIRTILLEIERITNHIGDLGNIPAGVGFSFASALGCRTKEMMMRLQEAIAGNRFLRGMIIPGGTAFDLTPELSNKIKETLAAAEKNVADLKQIFAQQDGFQDRVRTTGIVRNKTAVDLALVGVGARASGYQHDSRLDFAYGVYPELKLQAVTKEGGDVAARLGVRLDELAESFRLVHLMLNLLQACPETKLAAELGELQGECEGAGISESARGSDYCYTAFSADGKIDRIFVRSASYANWPALPIAVQGDIIPDFPLINKSFELCYACLDR